MKGTKNPPACPICGIADDVGDCSHLVGWTDDGKTIVDAYATPILETEVLPTDKLVNTGISCRVYRELTADVEG